MLLKLTMPFLAFDWMLKGFKIKKLQWRDFIKDDFQSRLCAECTARSSRARRQQRSLSSRCPAKTLDYIGKINNPSLSRLVPPPPPCLFSGEGKFCLYSQE